MSFYNAYRKMTYAYQLKDTKIVCLNSLIRKTGRCLGMSIVNISIKKVKESYKIKDDLEAAKKLRSLILNNSVGFCVACGDSLPAEGTLICWKCQNKGSK